MFQYCPVCERTTDDADAVFCIEDGSPLQPDPLMGRQLAGFKVTGRLGAGAMGVVYEAWQLSIQRSVALKVLPDDPGRLPELTRRFLKEARAVAAVEHPNTVAVYDFGQTDDGILYLAMELVDGHRLTTVLAEEGRMGVSRVCHIMVQICDSLASAHRHGVLHRDLKPDNIMIQQRSDETDVVKVLDFGLARFVGGISAAITGQGTVDGTAEYMSPETVMAQDVDERSDIYALGLILFELLTGRVPFSAPTPRAVMEMQAYDPPPSLPSQFPMHIRGLCKKALQKNPDDRPQTVAAFKELLVPLEALVPKKKSKVRVRPRAPRAEADLQSRPTDRAMHQPAPEPAHSSPPPRRRLGVWGNFWVGVLGTLLLLFCAWALTPEKVPMSPITWPLLEEEGDMLSPMAPPVAPASAGKRQESDSK